MSTIFGRRAAGARRARVTASPQWRDGAFHTPYAARPGLKQGAMPPVTEFFRNGAARAPGRPLPLHDPRAAWQRGPASGLRATWLGHSTVLLEIDGARVLTDPVWSERASPFGFAGPRRFHPAPVALDALPALDAVVLSHDHYDHLDRTAIRALASQGARVITSLGVGAHLEAWGVAAERIVELDWWESYELPATAVRVTATPAQHFSGRAPGQRNQSLWSGFALRGPRHHVFFSGDTGLTDAYRELPARLGAFDLALLEVGAFHPSWGDLHLGPDYAVDALEMLGNPRLMPVHWGTFDLALHTWEQPVERLVELAPSRGVALFVPPLGLAAEPSQAPFDAPWWRGGASADAVAEARGRAEEHARTKGLDEAPAEGVVVTPAGWPVD